MKWLGRLILFALLAALLLAGPVRSITRDGWSGVLVWVLIAGCALPIRWVYDLAKRKSTWRAYSLMAAALLIAVALNFLVWSVQGLSESYKLAVSNGLVSGCLVILSDLISFKTA